MTSGVLAGQGRYPQICFWNVADRNEVASYLCNALSLPRSSPAAERVHGMLIFVSHCTQSSLLQRAGYAVAAIHHPPRDGGTIRLAPRLRPRGIFPVPRFVSALDASDDRSTPLAERIGALPV